MAGLGLEILLHQLQLKLLGPTHLLPEPFLVHIPLILSIKLLRSEKDEEMRTGQC